jgi:hypothetical protein
MPLTRWVAVAVLGLPVPVPGVEPAPLPPTEASLLRVACSWADGSRADVAKQKCTAPSELEWSSARRGRFVERDGEWLVSLASPCIGGCSGVTFVARRAAGGWTKLYQEEGLVSDGCVPVRGLADGYERVACVGSAGPHMGGMAEWLAVDGYADEGSRVQVLYKDQGAECLFAEPPAKAEYDGDDLSDLTAGEAGSDVAFTIRLTVRRAECDQTVEDPESLATVRGEHVLRFVKRGNAVVPDDPTAALVDRHGWTPSR